MVETDFLDLNTSMLFIWRSNDIVEILGKDRKNFFVSRFVIGWSETARGEFNRILFLTTPLNSLNALLQPLLFLISDVWGVHKQIGTKIWKWKWTKMWQSVKGVCNVFELVFLEWEKIKTYDAKTVQKLVESTWVKMRFVRVQLRKKPKYMKLPTPAFVSLSSKSFSGWILDGIYFIPFWPFFR